VTLPLLGAFDHAWLTPHERGDKKFTLRAPFGLVVCTQATYFPLGKRSCFTGVYLSHYWQLTPRMKFPRSVERTALHSKLNCQSQTGHTYLDHVAVRRTSTKMRRAMKMTSLIQTRSSPRCAHSHVLCGAVSFQAVWASMSGCCTYVLCDVYTFIVHIGHAHQTVQVGRSLGASALWK